jgi:hypothetical protein
VCARARVYTSRKRERERERKKRGRVCAAEARAGEILERKGERGENSEQHGKVDRKRGREREREREREKERERERERKREREKYIYRKIKNGKQVYESSTKHGACHAWSCRARLSSSERFVRAAPRICAPFYFARDSRGIS